MMDTPLIDLCSRSGVFTAPLDREVTHGPTPLGTTQVYLELLSTFSYYTLFTV